MTIITIKYFGPDLLNRANYREMRDLMGKLDCWLVLVSRKIKPHIDKASQITCKYLRPQTAVI